MSQEQNHVETFKATAKGKGWSTHITITDTDWTLQADEPIEDGGSNTGPNPMQYFSTALVSCQNEQAQVVAEELSLSIDQIDITLEIDLDLSGFMGVTDHSHQSFKKANLQAIVSGSVSNKQVILLGNKVDSRCPILELLRSSGCEINSTWSVK